MLGELCVENCPTNRFQKNVDADRSEAVLATIQSRILMCQFAVRKRKSCTEV